MNTVNIIDATTWSSIDIFLFSNGQQYSPPRKYHLRAEELQWWGTTVSFLGRTHYGSGHSSVDLYTIDGTKVNGPLELVNGTAYVAVEPPDDFVDAGYEEYLVKASRSWEKRLVHRAKDTGIPKQDEIPLCTKDSASNMVNEKTNVNEHVDTKMETSRITDDTNSSPPESRPTKPHQYLQKKSISATKQNQKRKSSNAHNVYVRKISTDSEKNYPPAKKLPTRKNDAAFRKNSLVPCKDYERQSTRNNKRNSMLNSDCCYNNRNSTQSDTKARSNSKKNQHIQEDNDDSNIQEIEIIKQPNNSLPCKEASHLYKNGENDIPIISQSFESIKDMSTRICPEYQEKKQFPHIDDSIPNEVQSTREETKTEQELENLETDTLYNKNGIRNQEIAEKQVRNEYIAYMNKGGILMLKFNLKIKDCKTLCYKELNRNNYVTKSSSNLLNTEKISQADIAINFSAELLKTDEELSIQNKSLQSLLNKLYTDNVHDAKNPKIIVVQCACHDYPKNDKMYACETICKCNAQNEKDEAVRVVEDYHLKKTSTSCECNNDQSRETKVDQQENINRMSVPSTNTDKLEVPQSGNAFEKYMENKLDDSARHKSFKRVFDNPQNDIQNSRDYNYGQPMTYENDSNTSIQNNDADCAIKENDINLIPILTTRNKFTQTDWSNVLLEAKRNEDSTYTLHLPPLYVLKRCML